MCDFCFELARKGKIICPECGRKTFVPYVDAEGAILSPMVGKCDRADKCGHHYPPKQYFAEHGDLTERKRFKPITRRRLKPSFIGQEPLLESVYMYRKSSLYRYLAGAFPMMGMRVDTIFQRYLVGFHNHWPNSNIFWQVDGRGRIHAGKIMCYDPSTGKRIKEPANLITWYHSVAELQDFNLEQCLFGEHLLADSRDTVALVESEKTALVLSIAATNILPVACGGCGNLTGKLNDALAGRNILILPDKGQYGNWKEKSTLLDKAGSVFVSSIMEKSPLQQGDDVADLILGDTSQGNINGTIQNLFI